MIHPFKLADAVAVAGAVTSYELSADNVKNYTFVSSGTFTATVTLEGSGEPGSVTDANSKWETIGTISPTGTFIHVADRSYSKVRVNVTAYTSGSVTVWLKAVS